jgi:hypothetical protein
MPDALNWFPEMGCVEAEAAYFPPKYEGTECQSRKAKDYIPSTSHRSFSHNK